jgi:hypothetical protein
MPKVAISSPAASRQKWPVSRVICATVCPPQPMPSPDLVEALQFTSEIRHQFLRAGSARLTVPRPRREASQSPWFVTCTTGLEGAYLR